MSRISDGGKRAGLIAIPLISALLGPACKWTEELEGRNANRRANALFREMQFIDAAAAYQRALIQVKGSPIIHYNLGLAYSKMYRPGFDGSIRLGELTDPICQDIPETSKSDPPVSVCIKRPGEVDLKDRRRFVDCDEMTEIQGQLANKELTPVKRGELEARLEQLENEKDAQWDELEKQLADKGLSPEKRKEVERKLDLLETPAAVDICPSSFECKKTVLCTATSKQLADLAATNLQQWLKSQPSDEELNAQLKKVLEEQKAVQKKHEERMAPIREEQKATQPMYLAKLEKLRQEHEQNLAKIREEQKAGEPALKARLDKLKQEHERNLARIREQQNAGKAAHEQRLAQLRVEHEQVRMAQLKKDHEARLAKIRDRHGKRLAKIPPPPADAAAEDPFKDARARASQRLKNAEEKEIQRFKNAEGKELSRHKAAETKEIQAFKDAESKEIQKFKEAENNETTAHKSAETQELTRYKEAEGKETARFNGAEVRELQRYKGEMEPLTKRVDEITLKDDTRKQMTQAWIETSQYDKALGYWGSELAAKPSDPNIMGTIAGIHLKANDWRKSIEWFNKVADADPDPANKVAALNSIGNIAWSKLNSKVLDINESVELADFGLGALQKATQIQPKLAKLYGLQASIYNFRSLNHGASFAAAIDRASAQDHLRLTRVLIAEAKKQKDEQAGQPPPAPAPSTPAPAPTPAPASPSTPTPSAPAPAPATPPAPGGTAP